MQTVRLTFNDKNEECYVEILQESNVVDRYAVDGLTLSKSFIEHLGQIFSLRDLRLVILFDDLNGPVKIRFENDEKKPVLEMQVKSVFLDDIPLLP